MGRDLHFPGCPFSPGLLTGVKTELGDTELGMQSIDSVDRHPWDSTLAGWSSMVYRRDFVFDNVGRRRLAYWTVPLLHSTPSAVPLAYFSVGVPCPLEG